MGERQPRESRAAALQMFNEYDFELNGSSIPHPGFTCDDCGARFTCEFVYDLYNANGDCLAEK